MRDTLLLLLVLLFKINSVCQNIDKEIKYLYYFDTINIDGYACYVDRIDYSLGFFMQKEPKMVTFSSVNQLLNGHNYLCLLMAPPFFYAIAKKNSAIHYENNGAEKLSNTNDKTLRSRKKKHKRELISYEKISGRFAIGIVTGAVLNHSFSDYFPHFKNSKIYFVITRVGT